MKKETKLKIAAAHQHCEVMDKSTEYTLQFIQDTCNVSLDAVVSYMSLGQDEHESLFKQVNAVLDVVIKIESNVL